MGVQLRQWCQECQAATVTWIDPYGAARCSGHEPEVTWEDEEDDDEFWRMIVTSDNARLGRRNQSAGKRWQQDCAAWLRANGWPAAGYEIRNRSSDLIGTWDLAVECTITGWDKIWIKLDQSARDALARHLPHACVWKKRNGKTDPGQGVVLVRAWEFFRLVMRLEKLEHAELDAAASYDRGFTAGVEWARRHPAPAAAEEATA